MTEEEIAKIFYQEIRGGDRAKTWRDLSPRYRTIWIRAARKVVQAIYVNSHQRIVATKEDHTADVVTARWIWEYLAAAVPSVPTGLVLEPVEEVGRGLFRVK